jgi:hypothetical protein
MATMNGFDHILNWKLRRGSHQFPGRDGGTCINEAAIVAAGYQYRPVNSVEDMPKCFSRPICGFAMHLNDLASDAERQQLLPFATRLACADTAETERQREAYIVSRNRGRLSFQQRIEILEGALAIGRQADALGTDEVKIRMEDVRSRSTTATGMPDTPLSAKIKSWFSVTKEKETEPSS